MSGHTPGPWFYWGDSGVDYTVFATIPKPKGRDQYGREHEVLGVSEWIRLDEANARLISAAPELLEALLWLRNLASGVGRAGDVPEPGEFEDAVDAADVAIAKAEGRP